MCENPHGFSKICKKSRINARKLCILAQNSNKCRILTEISLALVVVPPIRCIISYFLVVSEPVMPGVSVSRVPLYSS